MARIFISYLLLLISVLSEVYSATCPDGFEGSLSDPDKCYLFVSIPKNWFDANQYCTTNANNLVSIHSRGENLNVLATVTASATIDRCDSKNFWIGGNDLTGKGTLTWTDGQRWDYNNFNATQGQPHYQINGCVSSQITRPVSSSCWKIESANNLNCFVCEYYISSGTLTTTPTPTTTPITSCATGWTNSISNSNKSFCLVTTKATWFNALLYCQNIAAQGTLATISNAFDQSQLNSIVFEHQAPCFDNWIGANDINQLGTFQWSDGQPLVYTNWAPGQPDLNNRCTAAQLQTNGQWTTEPCGVDNCFVCQKYTA
uniref:C-type lectin domain-containing protein n=1 Tax=Plectus sambesii TaxID=2011161 RepID=A0A914UUE3_9BILA